MAGTSPSFSPHVIRSTLLESPRNNRSPPSFSVRISAKSNGVSATCDDLAQGPYCIYVGPVESASKETLEALYRQVSLTLFFLTQFPILLRNLIWLILKPACVQNPVSVICLREERV